MSQPPELFDKAVHKRRRERFADALLADPTVFDELVARTVERLGEIKRPLETVLDWGCRTGALSRYLRHQGGRTVVHTDPSRRFAEAGGAGGIVADLDLVPFANESFDAVVSVGALHCVNDLPGTLIQLRRCLKPDGLLLLAIPGGDTLLEFRQSLMAAEIERRDGAGMRFAPLIDVRDLGGLLQRAGFALPVVDVDRVTLTYRDPSGLLRDLKHGGETNVVKERPKGLLSPRIAARAFELYAENHRDPRGRLIATLDVLFATAWAPDESQPKPAARGSGSASLAKAFGVTAEIIEGRAGPRTAVPPPGGVKDDPSKGS